MEPEPVTYICFAVGDFEGGALQTVILPFVGVVSQYLINKLRAEYQAKWEMGDLNMEMI